MALRKKNKSLDYEEKILKHRNYKTTLIIVALIAAVIVGFGIKIYYDNKQYKDIKSKTIIDIDTKSSIKYAKFADYLIKFSSDGAAYFDEDGEIWNQSYDMKEPMMDVCGSYAVVAEQKSNQIFIFDELGAAGQMTSSYPIVKVEVAGQGVVAALEEDKDANYIEVKDKDGNMLITGKTVLNGNGYPIDFSLSEDGTKMVVSYICIAGNQTETKVLFYNFSEVGKNEVDRMVGGFNHYKGTLVPMVEFINNDTAVAFGDSIFTIYSMKQKPEIVHEEKFTNEVKKVCYSEEHIGIVYYNSSNSEPFELVIYDLKGKKVGSYTYTKQYSKVKFVGDDVVLYNDFECEVISILGKNKFEYSFDEQIVDIMPTKKRYTYLFIGNDKIQEIKLK